MISLFRGLATMAILALAPLAGAQATSPAPSPTPATTATFAPPSDQWHLSGAFGFGAADGKYGDVLQKPLQWEVRIAKQSPSGAWRFGLGLQFGSMNPAEDPNIDPDVEGAWLAPDKEWARLETSFSVTRVFNPNGKFRPYLQGRVGIERIHPRSELFYVQPPPEDLEPGDSPTEATNGVGFTVQPGFEVALGKTLSLDVAGFYTYYKTGSYDMSPLGLPDVDSGHEWGGRVGLTWRPFTAMPPEPGRKPLLADPATGKPLPLPPADGSRDAWGVPRSWGWATAEMFAINWGASMFNEYVRDANFNQISPRSFWANLEEGFTYDDNEFKTNQLIHPFNGATYFNAARANGIGFWGSSAMSIAGAFIWECCGETHPMSFNDMVSTGIGGIARGELMYRVSSLILDNTKRGKGRVGREAAALLVNPIRGFNRLVTGDASEVKGNPVDPYEWRPTFHLDVRAGARVIGEGESITENTNTYGLIEAAISYGDAWDPDNRKPFDRFDAITQSNIGDKTRLGRLLIRGDLFSKLVSENHSLALQQDFDYIDNEAYEYGGQSLGPALLSRFELSPTTELWARTQAYFILLGAVNSELSVLADVAEQERIREYDYGPGVGGSVELYLMRKYRPLLAGRYRYSHISVSNGSIYNSEDGGAGLDSNHNIHQLGFKLEIPITKSLAAGAETSVFFRRSHYDFTGSDLPPKVGEPGRRTLTQRNPEVRVFLAWTYSH
jgi:opacity protein-like surface antigen